MGTIFSLTCGLALPYVTRCINYFSDPTMPYDPHHWSQKQLSNGPQFHISLAFSVSPFVASSSHNLVSILVRILAWVFEPQEPTLLNLSLSVLLWPFPSCTYAGSHLMCTGESCYLMKVKVDILRHFSSGLPSSVH